MFGWFFNVFIVESFVLFFILLFYYTLRYRPLLLLVGPRSPKTHSQNIATFKPFSFEIDLKKTTKKTCCLFQPSFNLILNMKSW